MFSILKKVPFLIYIIVLIALLNVWGVSVWLTSGWVELVELGLLTSPIWLVKTFGIVVLHFISAISLLFLNKVSLYFYSLLLFVSIVSSFLNNQPLPLGSFALYLGIIIYIISLDKKGLLANFYWVKTKFKDI
jgi:hypothetical protein